MSAGARSPDVTIGNVWPAPAPAPPHPPLRPILANKLTRDTARNCMPPPGRLITSPRAPAQPPPRRRPPLASPEETSRPPDRTLLSDLNIG
ncbi:unnamed protein product, partial [Brenthis ino]